MDLADLPQLVELVEAGRLTVPVAATYPLKRAAIGPLELRNGRNGGWLTAPGYVAFLLTATRSRFRYLLRTNCWVNANRPVTSGAISCSTSSFLQKIFDFGVQFAGNFQGIRIAIGS